MERCLGLLLVVALLAGLAACSVAAKEGSHRTDDDVRHATAHRPTTVTKGHAGAPTTQEEPTAGEQTAAVAAVPATWDYVALGDSLAAGVGARSGYVERYAAHIEDRKSTRLNSS